MSEKTPSGPKEEIYQYDLLELGRRVGRRRERRRNGKLVSEEWENAAGELTERVLYEYSADGKPTKETWTHFKDPSRSGCREFEYDERGKLKDKHWIPHVNKSGA